MIPTSLERRVAELEVQVDWLRQLVDQLYNQLSVPPPVYQPPVGLPAMEVRAATPQDAAPVDLSAVFAAIDAGQLIVAIKAYRERTGVGLKEAKDAVEALAARR